jgi:uncharacterized repeat protein (TIGR02543 family)
MWQELKLTVTFDADGGTIDITGEETYTITDILYDSTVTLPTAVKDGCQFGGWYTETNGGGTQFTASTRVTADITVYAKWQYEVTFDANGGTFPETAVDPWVDTRLVTSGDSVGTEMPVNPTRDGYFFGGWFTQPGGSIRFTSSTAVLANTVVYAKWVDETMIIPLPPESRGVLRFTILWNMEGANIDDFDAYCLEPNGVQISYSNKVDFSTGGNLDRDETDPRQNDENYGIENITWPNQSSIPDGNYTFWVHNFAHRSADKFGFIAEIAFGGNVYHFNYPNGLSYGENVQVAVVNYSSTGGYTLVSSLPIVSISIGT